MDSFFFSRPEEFEKYKIGENTTITFCMRELRAILNFAESMNINISAHFDTAGKYESFMYTFKKKKKKKNTNQHHSLICFFTFFLLSMSRPIVFVINDFDTFEANLVMSTLSPEDTEFECQQSRSMAQANLQNSTTDNIVLDKSTVDGDGDAAIAADKEPDSHEDDELNNGIVNAKKRNHSLANFSDTFESNTSKRPSLDIVLRTKNRRTSTEHRRDTHIPSANGTQATNRTEKSPPPLPHVDLESENIEVVFQEDSPDLNNTPQVNNGIECMDVDMDSNEQLNNLNVNDHRPKARQIFERCYSGNTPSSELFGATLAEASDDEQ